MADRDGWGGKTGGGGAASASVTNVARLSRLRSLTQDTVDLRRDPYFLRNHLGSVECKLCLSLHATDGGYLAHTAGRRRVKIGRPGYKIIKQREPPPPPPATAAAAEDAAAAAAAPPAPAGSAAGGRGRVTLVFSLDYPEIGAGLQPRHRFMSAFEQRVERPPDGRWVYLLFAAEPYETVAFKIPNRPMDRTPGGMTSVWDEAAKTFSLTLTFLPLPPREGGGGEGGGKATGGGGGERPRPGGLPAADPFAGLATV